MSHAPLPRGIFERHHLRSANRTVGAGQQPAQALNGPRVQLRNPRFVDANLGANLLHRDLVVVVEAEDALVARRQRRDRHAHAVANLALLAETIRRRALGRRQHGRQRRLVGPLGRRERRGRFDRVDPHDGATELCLVGAHARRQVRQRRLAAHLAAQLLPRGLEFSPHATHAARPRIPPERVDHGPTNTPLRECLELDPATLVEAVRGVHQAQDPILHQVVDLDGVGHGRRDTPRQGLHERQAGLDAVTLGVGHGLSLHGCLRAVETPGRSDRGQPGQGQ